MESIPLKKLNLRPNDQFIAYQIDSDLEVSR